MYRDQDQWPYVEFKFPIQKISFKYFQKMFKKDTFIVLKSLFFTEHKANFYDKKIIF